MNEELDKYRFGGRVVLGAGGNRIRLSALADAAHCDAYGRTDPNGPCVCNDHCNGLPGTPGCHTYRGAHAAAALDGSPRPDRHTRADEGAADEHADRCCGDPGDCAGCDRASARRAARP